MESNFFKKFKAIANISVFFKKKKDFTENSENLDMGI